MEIYKENLFHYMDYIGHPPNSTDVEFQRNHLIVSSEDFNFVMFHPDFEVSKLKNLMKTLNTLSNLYVIAEEILRPKLEEYCVRFIPLVKLLTNYPMLAQVPKFDLIDDPEALSNDQLIVLDELKQILFDDPTAVWLDAKVGDVIRIVEPDKVSGVRIDYRRVIKI